MECYCLWAPYLNGLRQTSVEVVTKIKPANNVERETCQGTGITEAGTGFKVSAVNMSKPESVERETCQGVGKGYK